MSLNNSTTSSLIPTAEQLAILNCESDKIAINALAGTGKTSTLVFYANKYSHKKMLYLCYNKSIAMHAQNLFPSNVVNKTFHSLAYRYVGFKYANTNKLSRPLTSNEIIKILSLQSSSRSALLALAITNTLNKFCSSSDTKVVKENVDMEILNSSNVFKGKESDEIEAIVSKVAGLTQKLWNNLIDLKNDSPITHDIYLKLFTLNPPTIKDYDVILIDEAQDLTPCFVDFIEKQNKQVIFVGDKHQSIYGWRGAVNYLDSLADTQIKEFYLTQSFRFGQNLADLSNCVLTYLGAQNHIKGLDGQSTKIILSENGYKKADNNSNATQPSTGTHAIIARHNWSIYEKLVANIHKKENLYVEGGLNYKELKDLSDLHTFRQTKKTNNHLYEGFDSFEEMEKQMFEGLLTDPEVTRKILIVSRWGTNFSRNMAYLNAYYNEQKDKKATPSSIILTTVHKAKGKEYDRVEITDDFLCHISSSNKENMELLYDANAKGYSPKKINYKNLSKDTKKVFGSIKNPAKYLEEMNIFYVALTRAKKEIVIPREYFEVLDCLNHILKYGINDKLMEKAFQSSIYLDLDLLSLFEKEKIKLALGPEPGNIKRSNPNKI